QERAEVFEILRARGLPEADIAAFADLYGRHPDLLADFMMTHEIGMADPRDGSPVLGALATFVSFLFFGAIPLIPYFLREPTETTFHLSVAATFLALVLLGLLRWKVTTRTALRAIGETVAIGGTCAVVAYAVGMLVGG
ncbi:MAG TPA: VIT1/CCC1 transporter family protein, partial [Thermohalobaculum sp.]|nr:VIT1/CCC1 transporter family protein [Thermohalobaculum sp.]